MNLKKTLGAAALIASAVMPSASAREMGAPELFWMFFSLAAQHAFMPARLEAHARPAQDEAAVCDALQFDPQGFRKPALDVPRPGPFCLRQDYVFECAPYGCGDDADDVGDRHPYWRREVPLQEPVPEPIPARESAP